MNNNDQQEKVKILIVDDSPEAIDDLVNTIPREYKQQIALSGEKALELLNATDDLPDIILLDVLMTGMNGFEVCRLLNLDIRFKDIPVIFISSLNEPFDKVQAFKMGGVDYITKPFQSEEVLARVSVHLEIASRRKEITDLYSKTLQGTIRVMNEMLAIANPEVSRVSDSMRLYAERIMEELSIKDSWDLKLACMLSGIGMLTLIFDKRERKYFKNINESIDSRNINTVVDINKIYGCLSLSAQIIDNIPKLGPIAEIIKNSMTPLDKNNQTVSISNMKHDVLKGHILRTLIHYSYKIRHEINYFSVLEHMREDKEEFYSAEILDVLGKVENNLSQSHIFEVRVEELKPKMILAEDVSSMQGKLLLKAGYELSESLIIILKNSGDLKNIKIKTLLKFDDIIYK